MEISSLKLKSKSWLPWFCLCAAFIGIIGSYALHGENHIDSDQASELVLANMLNREGGIITKNWYYSTELRVLNSQLVYRVGLMLFPDWHGAVTFSLAVMLLILTGSYLFLSKAADFSRMGIWTAILLMLPFSRQYVDFFLFGGYYLPHLAISFVCVGIMLHCSIRWKQLPLWKRIAEIVILSALCIAAGMGGVRELLICFFPMLVTAVGLVLLRLISRKRVWGTTPHMALLSLIAMLAGSVGYWINRYLLSNGYHAVDYSGTELQPVTLQSIRRLLAQAAWAIGWNGFPGETFTQTIQSLMTIVLILLISTAFIIGCCRWRRLKDAQKFLLMYFPVNFLLVMLACAFTGNWEARFLLPSLLCFPFILQIGLEGTKSRWRKWLCAALAICMLANSTLVLLRLDIAEKTSIRNVTEWLVENEYEAGFATFWNSNIITALSDGEIEMWTVVPSWMPQWSELTLYPWLQAIEHLEKLPDGKIFLLLTAQEDEAEQRFSLGGRELYRHDGYVIYEYESAAGLYGTIGISH